VSRQVILAAGKDIVLPNGIRYQGGSTVILSDRDYSQLSAAFKAGKLTSDSAVPPADYWSGQQLASGETCIPRIDVGQSAALTSGTMQLTYWTAAKTETVNNIIGNTAGTAAGATPTYCAMGCYLVNADNSLTLQGACANDTTLFAATFGSYTRAVTTPFQKVQGKRYAYAVLVVSAAAMPNFNGYNGTVAMSTVSPRVAAALTGQSTIPASITSASLSSASQMLCGAVTP